MSYRVARQQIVGPLAVLVFSGRFYVVDRGRANVAVGPKFKSRTAARNWIARHHEVKAQTDVPEADDNAVRVYVPKVGEVVEVTERSHRYILLGHYTLLERHGAKSRAWQAQHKGTGRTVTLYEDEFERPEVTVCGVCGLVQCECDR
jgi:hypothetical protein